MNQPCLRCLSCGEEYFEGTKLCATCDGTEFEPIRGARKDCPYCGEEILAVALKCKHCGEFLDSSATAASVAASRLAIHAESNYQGTPGNSPRVRCPHCGVAGGVDVLRVKQKKGISGGKATAAVLTAGFSVLGTGLSRKETVSEAHCANCDVTWVMG